MSETLDGIMGGRVALLQPATGYRAAIDPVILAAACPARPGETVLDLGCGVGTAALCLLARVDCFATGIDIQPEMITLAERNGTANAHGDHFQAICGSVLTYRAPAPFDHIIANPPYLTEGYGSGESTLATHESDAKLADWIAAAAKHLKPGGTAVFVHRADRVDELLPLFSRHFGSLSLFPLYPRTGTEARRVLIGGIKAKKAPPRLLSGLVLHEEDGTYTPAAEAMLCGEDTIRLWPT